MATVIGPTPPGTGVINDATSLTSSKSTSPTKRLPDFFVASETKVDYKFNSEFDLQKSIDFLLNPFFVFRNDLYVNLLHYMYTCCYTKMK